MNTNQYGRLLPNGTLEIMPDKFKTSIIIGVKRVVRPTEMQLIQAGWKPITYENAKISGLKEIGNRIVVTQKVNVEDEENGNKEIING